MATDGHTENPGYSMQGFRGKLVKPWCREMQQYKGFYDVPDGMHVQGWDRVGIYLITFFGCFPF